MKIIKRVNLMLSLVVLMLVSMTSAEQYVQVDSSGQTIDKISYATPNIGKTFLLVDITISNHGYDNVNTNPSYFQVEVNKVKYSYESVSYSLGDIGKPILDSVGLGDGGQISGYLVFQIPADTTNWTLIFDEGYPPKVVRSNTNTTPSGGWVYQ
jgi:hypothetical protein